MCNSKKGLQKYLDRSDITEIAVNRPGFVWVEESSGWRCYEDKNFTYDYLAKLGNVCAVYGGENKNARLRSSGALRGTPGR